jgi:2-polyprenyl-6-methoxyphenol hydroxylase-like FAD-dependent oxidoreductase
MAVKKVLVVGGGITGTVATLALAQKGVDVTLIEISPVWHGVGHGITLQGNALKVFNEIGAFDEMLERGHGFDFLDMFNAEGVLLNKIPTAKTGGEDLPATMGALRADIQDVLVRKIHELGVEVRLGTEMVGFENHPDSVTVTFNDGSTEDFDAVVACDGIKSKTRKLLGITHDKKSSGMGIWRVVTERTPEMDCSGLAYGGPEYKAGYTPISKDLCYAFVLTEPQRPDNGLSDQDEFRRLLEGYHGNFDFIRENIKDDDYLNFQEIEWLFVDDQPWHQGRVILIGDAVHAAPPLIAQGGAQCAEDALLIAEYLTKDGDIEQNFVDYTERRKKRVGVVVRNTMQLVEWEIHPETPGANPGMIMGQTLGAMAQPW